LVRELPPRHSEKAAQQSSELRDLIVKYNQVLLNQVRTTAACNAVHHVEARLSR
jgi:hypothetical protein